MRRLGVVDHRILLSVAAHAVGAREAVGTGPAARATVLHVVSHRDAPAGAAQPAERAPLPARAAVARAGQHVGAQAAAAPDEPPRPFATTTGAAGARAACRVPTAALAVAANLPRSRRGRGEEPACGSAAVISAATTGGLMNRRCVCGRGDCGAQDRGCD